MWYLTWILGLSLVIALVTFFAVKYEAREAAHDSGDTGTGA